MRRLQSQSLSIALHAGAIILLALLGSRTASITTPGHSRSRITPVYFTPPRVAHVPERHAGGANQDHTPVRRGVVPPRSYRAFIPPHTVPDPKLPLAITVAFEAPPLDAAPRWGDPLSRLGEGSLGNGGVNGIGARGCCVGVGPDSGRPGFDAHGSTGRLLPPKLIYKVEPEFSEEARKAKYQGMVVLAIEVDETGRPRNMRVVSSLGMGLDQKALEAVELWRFRPASRDGKPVAATARVEVSFHLL